MEDVGKTLGWAGATRFCALSAAQNFVGSLPPAPSPSGPCFARVQGSQQAICNALCNASRITKGGETLGTLESTVEATKKYNPSGAPGGRGQAQPGQVRRIHRRERFLRRERGAQAPVQEGPGVQALGRSARQQSQPKTNPRRNPDKDRVTNMKPRPTQFGVRENTASSRQHASRLAIRSLPVESVRKSETANGSELAPRPTPYEAGQSQLSLNGLQNEATGGTNTGRGRLLTVEEVAILLHVPVSWAYGRTRKRSLQRLPGYRIGKYWRFREDEIHEWIKRQRGGPHAA